MSIFDDNFDVVEEGFPFAKVKAAQRYLYAVKPWWNRFGSRMKIVPISVPAPPGKPYGALTSTDQKMNLYIDKSFAMNATLSKLAGAIEHELQHHVRNSWGRLKWLTPAEKEKYLNISLDLEINSAIRQESKDVTFGKVKQLCSLSSTFTVADIQKWGVEELPNINDDAWFPDKLGFDEGLSAESYYRLIKANEPAPQPEPEPEPEPEKDQDDQDDQDDSEDQQEDSSDGDSGSDENDDSDQQEDNESNESDESDDEESSGSDSPDQDSQDGQQDEDQESSDEDQESGEDGEDGQDNPEDDQEGEESDEGDPGDSDQGDDGDQSDKKGSSSSSGSSVDGYGEGDSDSDDSPGEGQPSQSPDKPGAGEQKPRQKGVQDTIKDLKKQDPSLSWFSKELPQNEDEPSWKPEEDKSEEDVDSGKEMKDALEELARDINKAKSKGGSGGYGLTPGAGLLEWSDTELKRLKVNWQAHLSKAISSSLDSARIQGASDLSYAVRNPNQEQIGPVMMGLLDYSPKLMVVQDVSGSMMSFMDTSLSAFKGIVQASMNRFGDGVTWVTVDTEIVDVGKTITFNDDLVRRWQKGLGGTVFQKVLGDIVSGKMKFENKRYPRPDLLLLSTDCFFSWPWKDMKRIPGRTKIIVCSVVRYETAQRYLPEWVQPGKNFIYMDPDF